MYKEQVYVTTNVALILDGIVVILSGYGAYYLRWAYGDGMWAMDGGLFISIVLSLMFINCFVLGQLGFYASNFNPPPLASLIKCGVAVAIDFSLLTMGVFFIKEESLSRVFIGSYATLVLLGTWAVRFMFFLFFHKNEDAYALRRILLIGSSDRAEAVLKAFERQKSWGHKIIGWLSVGPLSEIPGLTCLGSAEEFAHMSVEKDIDEVVFAVPPGEKFDFAGYLDICKKLGLNLQDRPGHVHP